MRSSTIESNISHRAMQNLFVLVAAVVVAVAASRSVPALRADDAPAKVEIAHEFHYTPAAGATTKPVNLAGEFNGWSTTATPMNRGDDGTYRTVIKLAPGKHLYKFVVDGNTWVNDPAADKSLEEDDGQQGKNSAVVVSAQDKPAEVEHTFSFKPAAGTADVHIAGDFNGWSTDATPMTRGDDGTFTAKVKLSVGTHHYKFVADGTKWANDPDADKTLDEADGHGGANSGVVVK